MSRRDEVPHREDECHAVDDKLYRLLEQYRATYLEFFLKQSELNHRPGYRGAYANINSVTGRPYAHHCCYSWTDGRTLGELSATWAAGLSDDPRLRAYADHLCEVLLERYHRNGYFPHVVEDKTNLATADRMNVPIGAGESSFSHAFVIDGLLQYGLAFGSEPALALAWQLMGDLDASLRDDRFLEGPAPRPTGRRAQGPFMITLGVVANALETLDRLQATRDSNPANGADRLLPLGRECLQHILSYHHRPADHAFWEVNQDGEALRDGQGRVVTDPGHTLEFTGFAARLAAYLEPQERDETLRTCLAIFLWAAARGFHPTRDLIYKNVDRDSGEPIANETVADISQVVSADMLQRHFGGKAQPATLATFPWWIPMELLAAGSVLRCEDVRGEVDQFILRAGRGILAYYRNPRLGGLCYQNIGDGFFDYIDVPPATPTLDLMHCHRSLRLFLRHQRPADTAR